ncbi:MAG: DUF3667 domain-containing protein [Muribaculaceae bacterium]|nr:DUF3667 domain-containing protein [Muribaculaceae bacterium]MDE6359741.1 DUF3667 domain-containing protein [Muribaculaceae bacterium]
MDEQSQIIQSGDAGIYDEIGDAGRDACHVCLNCGAAVDGNFCSSCGQPTNTGRFTTRSFATHVFGALTRVSTNFFVTLWRLLSCPWTVVRDYVFGRRVGLVSPVNMLLLLSLYNSVFFLVVSWWSGKEEKSEVISDDSWYAGLLNYFYDSITLQYMVLAIPLAVSTWVVYYRDIKGRYNFAELMIAVLYLTCTYLVLCLLLTPVEMLNDTLAGLLVFLSTSAYGVLSLNRAFPQLSRKMTLVKLVVWFVVSCLFAFLTFGFLSVPLVIDKI